MFLIISWVRPGQNLRNPQNQNNRFFGILPVFQKKKTENPTSDSKPTSKVTYIVKFSSRSAHFSILAPNLAGPGL